MDKGMIFRALEELENQSTIARFLVAVISVMVGRFIDYAYFKKKWPTWKQAAVEPLVVVFLGALSGVVVEIAGLETAWAIGGVCAGLGSLGATIVFQLSNSIIKKYTGKDVCITNGLIRDPVEEKDKDK